MVLYCFHMFWRAAYKSGSSLFICRLQDFLHVCVCVCVYHCIKSYQSGCSETEQSGCIATQPPHPFHPFFPFFFLLLCVWGFQLQPNLKTSIKLSLAHFWVCHLEKKNNQHSACVRLCPVGFVCRSHKAEHMKEEERFRRAIESQAQLHTVFEYWCFYPSYKRGL